MQSYHGTQRDVNLPDSGPHMRIFTGPGAPAQAAELNHNPMSSGCGSQPNLTRRAGGNTWKLNTPVMTRWEEDRADHPQSETSTSQGGFPCYAHTGVGSQLHSLFSTAPGHSWPESPCSKFCKFSEQALPPTQAKELNQSHTHYWVWLPTLTGQKGWWECLEVTYLNKLKPCCIPRVRDTSW